MPDGHKTYGGVFWDGLSCPGMYVYLSDIKHKVIVTFVYVTVFKYHPYRISMCYSCPYPSVEKHTEKMDTYNRKL